MRYRACDRASFRRKLPRRSAYPEDAMRAMWEYGLAFWAAMLWATARRAGAKILIAEDFQDDL
jgi:predicted nucleic acid-binding protein